MNIMLTGGCGYIGTPLTKKLIDNKHNVCVIDTQWFGNFLEPHPNLKIIKLDILEKL